MSSRQRPALPSLPPAWPEGRGVALCVNVMLEAWPHDAPPAMGPLGAFPGEGVLDSQARSWAEYGSKTGGWRLIDILARAGVRAVFYTSGLLAERNPELMRAVVEAGHPLGLHGWSQNVIPATQAAEAEEADLDRCLAAVQAATGARPRGWLSPRATPSPRTSALLAARGFAWQADAFDADLPYRVQTPNGPILALPFTLDINDLAVRNRGGPELFPGLVQRALDGWSLAGGAALLDITVHAHVFGRPIGAMEFARALEVAKAAADRAWLTDHAQVAEAFSAA